MPTLSKFDGEYMSVERRFRSDVDPTEAIWLALKVALFPSFLTKKAQKRLDDLRAPERDPEADKAIAKIAEARYRKDIEARQKGSNQCANCTHCMIYKTPDEPFPKMESWCHFYPKAIKVARGHHCGQWGKRPGFGWTDGWGKK